LPEKFCEFPPRGVQTQIHEGVTNSNGSLERASGPNFENIFVAE